MKNTLIVEGSSVLRLKIRSIVNSSEINVVEARNVEEVKDNSFTPDYLLEDIDLLILDIQFGEEVDFSLLSYIQKKDLDLPVIVLSANDRRETVLKAYRFGAVDYLLKPFDGQVLKSKVDYYLLEENKGQLISYPEENNIVEYFKLELLQELSRVLRGESEFSILKLATSSQNEDDVITKDLLLSLMRGIDKIYKLTENKFLLLTPLTDKSGARVLFERLNKYLEGHLDDSEIQLDLLLTFPEDITDVIEQNKIVEYQHQILEKVFKEQ